MHGLGQSQRALLGTISEGMSSVGEAQNELESKAQLPQLGADPVSQTDIKHRILQIWPDEAKTLFQCYVSVE